MEKLELYSDEFIRMGMHYAPKVLAALLVFVLGLWATNWLAHFISRSMMRKGLDVSLQSFLSSLVGVALKVLLLITVAGMLGIQTTSFVAVLGAAGLAVGLALQGSLSNFAGGVLILVFKPYKVGDLIESAGQFGEVKEIQIFNTVLLTPENKTAILPNGAVSNGTIVNFSRHGNLRVDITVAVAPDNSIEKVKQVVLALLAADEKVLKDPAPSVNVLSLANGMVTLAVRPYATPANYWDVFFGVQEKIKLAFEQNGIAGPVPHQVVIDKRA
ncbi:MAG TPA: mechanosensitive ion channel domain-containing protein [Chitinophagales bacterium]|nr:mechanosensitive ion channel domain-containing protein [Chitinophagales bacterium]